MSKWHEAVAGTKRAGLSWFALNGNQVGLPATKEARQADEAKKSGLLFFLVTVASCSGSDGCKGLHPTTQNSTSHSTTRVVLTARPADNDPS